MPYKFILPGLYALVSMLMLANCITGIDYGKANADQEQLVVFGGFTDGPGPHRLRLTRPSDYEKQIFLPVKNATVTLSDDAGNQYPYVFVNPSNNNNSYYELSNVRGVPGRSYSLNIVLSTGIRYQSRSEKMPEPLALDGADFEEGYVNSVTPESFVLKEPFVFVYARTSVPALPADRCLRWESDCTFLFNEIQFDGPFAPPAKQCFVTSRVGDQVVSIADLNNYQPGTQIREKAGQRRVDYVLESRVSFNIYQRVINRSAYEYWQKAKGIIAPTGTIFDAPPARLIGNIENISQPEQPALGIFEVASVDTIHIFKNRSDLSEEFRRFVVPYCNAYAGGKPAECIDCLSFSISSLQKPDWW